MSPNPTTDAKVVEAQDPGTLPGRLRQIGGSKSDDWNNLVANQAVQALWLAHSDSDAKHRHRTGTIAALVGIDPKDELEGMLAAQLIAAQSQQWYPRYRFAFLTSINGQYMFRNQFA